MFVIYQPSFGIWLIGVIIIIWALASTKSDEEEEYEKRISRLRERKESYEYFKDQKEKVFFSVEIPLHLLPENNDFYKGLEEPPPKRKLFGIFRNKKKEKVTEPVETSATACHAERSETSILLFAYMAKKDRCFGLSPST